MAKAAEGSAMTAYCIQRSDLPPALSRSYRTNRFAANTIDQGEREHSSCAVLF
jgi:hypothetical protein